MNPVLGAMQRALRDLGEPRVLALSLVPPLAALVVWVALGWAFAGDWARGVANWIATTPWLSWMTDWGLSWILIWASGLAAIALLLPILLITALAATNLIAMPVLVPLVGERHYPGLKPMKGGTFAGSVGSALAAVAIFAALWIVSLPFWFTGIGALLLPPLISAQFNQRMFRYDALAEHATPVEYQAVIRGLGGRLYGLGLVLALLLYVPFVNLLVPILGGLAFTHLCLAELARLRGQAVTGDAGMANGAETSRKSEGESRK